VRELGELVRINRGKVRGPGEIHCALELE